jgi:TRAP-type C4-dicarboxylate transport system substrate-binding protein
VKHILTGIAALTLTLAASTAPTVAATKLKFSTFGSAKGPIQRCAYLPVLDEITKRSGGKITFEDYFGGQFGRPGRQYDQLVRGVMDISVDILTYKPGAFPLSELMTLPLMYRDAKKASRALMKVYPTLLKKELGGVHIMVLAVTTPYVFHLREPIKNLHDLKGKRIRVSGRALIDALARFGINGVAMPVTQQYENLQKGVIAGSLGTWTTVAAFKLQEVTKFHYDMDFSGSVLFMGMNKQAYAKLSPDEKKAIDSVSTADVAARMSGCFEKGDAIGMALSKKTGGKSKVATPAERAEAEKILEPMIDSYLAKAEKRNPNARKVYKALKAAIAAQ